MIEWIKVQQDPPESLFCPDFKDSVETSVTDPYTVWRANVRICEATDHNWEASQSYAGPNSAKDIFSCTRCGKSFQHIYY